MTSESATHADRSRARRFSSSRARAVVFVVCVVAVVVLAEIVTRAYLGERMPDAALFDSVEVDVKYDRLQVLSKQGDIDLVYVGSSLIGVDVVPSIVDDALGTNSYSASLAAARPSILTPWLQDVVLEALDPAVVVIGVSSVDFQAPGGDDRTDAFLGSRGYRMVSGEESLMESTDRWLFQHSDLWRHRSEIRDPYRLLEAAFGIDNSPVDWRRLTEEDGHLDMSGLPGGGAEFAPQGDVTYLEGWDVDEESVTALRDLVAAVRDAGALPVLVSMPLTGEFIEAHPHGESDYERYEAALRDLADAESVPLLFYEDRDPANFVDLVHLDARASGHFSEQLARDLERLGVIAGSDAANPGFGDPLPATEPLTFGPSDGT